ncbi:iron ABC transporter permease [soil metagenome]
MWLWIPTLAAAGAATLPLAYLLIRAGGEVDRALAVLTAGRTLTVLLDTILMTALVTGASIALALPLAWLTTRTDLPGRRVWAVLTVLPLVIPTYVGGFTFVAALGPRGMLQSWLGVDRIPSIYGLWGAVLVLTLFTYPYVLLTVRSSMSRMDPSLEAASRSLGRTPWGTFREVTLPLLRPSISAGGLLVALYALSDFGAVSLLRFDSFTRVIYTSYRAGFDRGRSAILALLLVVLTMVVVSMESRVRGRAKLYTSGGGAAAPPSTVALSRWRIPALLLVATVVLLALVVPLGVLAHWLVRGVSQGEPLRLTSQTWIATWGSVRASAAAAAVSALVAIPIAVLGVRYRSRAAVGAERLSYLGFALPGIVVALSLVFFGARYLPVIYQTLPLLVFAYVVLFLPQAIGATRTSLLQVSPSLEDAARGLGRRPLGVMARVTAPLIAPGIAAGAALVFLTAMKELPATLLLGPTGYRTLATDIWGASAEAFYARAAAPALVLVLIAGVPLTVLLHRRSSI